MTKDNHIKQKFAKTVGVTTAQLQIGVRMWFFLISNIAGSILGSAADSWFADTKAGKWFYKKVDDVSTWASKKLGLKVLQDEENWKTKYPNVSRKIDELEARIKQLEGDKNE